MNYQFPIQNETLNLKVRTNGHDRRVQRARDTEFLVVRDGISNRQVKLVLVLLHTGSVAGRKHGDHSFGESLSHVEHVSQDDRLDDKMILRQCQTRGF